MDEQISYNRWNILQISILRFRFFFGVIGIPQSFKNNTPGLIKAMFLFGLDIEMAQNWEDFVPILCFIPAIPRAHPDGWSFFPSSKPPNFVVSPWAHLWLWESGILVTGPEMGGSGEVSTRDTLGSRIHPKTSYHWNLPKKKTQPLRLKEIKKDGNAIFSVFQDVSGFQPLFHGVIFRWEMATASQVKVERFQTRFYKTACRP